MKIGDKVMLYCTAHNMTMMQFSHMIGADLREVLNCTCQNTAPQFRIICTMSEKMGVSIRYLMDDNCADTQKDQFLDDVLKKGYSQYGLFFVKEMLALMQNLEVRAVEREPFLRVCA